MAEGCRFISGHRGFMISVAGQQGHDGIAEPCWYMKGYPTVPCTKATAGEQMVWCLSEKGRAIWATAQTASGWSNVYICILRKTSTVKGKRECVWEQNVLHFFDYMLRLNSSCCSLLYLNKVYLLLSWAGVRLNHSSCVYSLFLRLQNPTERQREGKTNMRDGKRALRTPAYDSENWTTRRWEGENESPSSFLLSLHHLGPLQVGTCGCSVRDLSFFSCPPHHFDIVPLLLYVKTAQAAIWLWVMEGGLNSPSEILEPVGKPQLFKCRKSWFYKMLIWSALGTSEQNGSEQDPPPLPQPHLHLFSGVETGRAKERRRGDCDKRREKTEERRRNRMRRWRKRGKDTLLFCSPHAILVTLHLLVNSPKLEKTLLPKWQRGMTRRSMLNIALSFLLISFSFPMPLTFHFSKSISLHLRVATW